MSTAATPVWRLCVMGVRAVTPLISAITARGGMSLRDGDSDVPHEASGSPDALEWARGRSNEAREAANATGGRPVGPP